MVSAWPTKSFAALYVTSRKTGALVSTTVLFATLTMVSVSVKMGSSIASIVVKLVTTRRKTKSNRVWCVVPCLCRPEESTVAGDESPGSSLRFFCAAVGSESFER